MKQNIDNQLLIDVLNNKKQSIKIFVDIVMSTINGALIMKFDQFSKEDREDVIQNIIVKEIFGSNGDWIGIKKFRGDSKFTTYLYKITYYRALDYLKSKNMKYKQSTDSIDNPLINLSIKEMNIEDNMTLEKAIKNLNEKEKDIIKLSLEGYKHREIADKFKIPVNTVSSLISRVLKKLKNFMQEN